MLAADCNTDLEVFRKAMDDARKFFGEGDSESAECSLFYALSLWREPHLASLPETLPIEPMRLQLTEEHYEAVSLLTDAQLALGKHRQLIGPLLARTKHHPLDQHCWVQLITALYAVGRHYEAFARYEDLRRHTSEASGTDPSLEAQQLYKRMLDADPTLQRCSSAASSLRSPS
jgi:DNA-binding SARP family transcriptional activator